MDTRIQLGAPILVVKRPWVDMLCDGSKTIEVRRSHCRKPNGTIVYFSESGTGCIVGKARFVESVELVADWQERRAEHRVETVAPPYGNKTHGWRFVDPTRIDPPVPYVVKPGAIVWRKYASTN